MYVCVRVYLTRKRMRTRIRMYVRVNLMLKQIENDEMNMIEV